MHIDEKEILVINHSLNFSVLLFNTMFSSFKARYSSKGCNCYSTNNKCNTSSTTNFFRVRRNKSYETIENSLLVTFSHDITPSY
nr:MAG TPA: hypothetical protein [Caudoviricetes sp.]